jgi:protein-tyrosine phosphatase
MLKAIKSFIPNKLKRNIKLIFLSFLDSVKYYTIRNGLFPAGKIQAIREINRIVFVCKGNVCRSVFAEYRCKQLINNTDVDVVSCGLDVNQGVYPPPDSVYVCNLYSCDVKKHKSVNHRDLNLHSTDLIFAMEYWHYNRLIDIYPHIKNNIFLLRSISPLLFSINCNIADPYNLGVSEFKKTYRTIDRALNELVRLQLL